MAARWSYAVAAQPGCAALASAAAWRTSSAVALPTRVITAPVAGSSTSSEPPIAGRHCAPNKRPRHVDSMSILGIGAFIPHPLPAASFRLVLARRYILDPLPSAADREIRAIPRCERRYDRIQPTVGGQDCMPSSGGKNRVRTSLRRETRRLPSAWALERAATARGAAPRSATFRHRFGVSQALERIRKVFAVIHQGGSRMRENRTYGSMRGACDETHVPTVTQL